MSEKETNNVMLASELMNKIEDDKLYEIAEEAMFEWSNDEISSEELFESVSTIYEADGDKNED